MKRFTSLSIYTLFLFAFLAYTLGAEAQNVNPRAKKTEVKVNEMDVIYEDEDYEDLMIDERSQEEFSKQTIPNLLTPPPLRYEDDYDPVKPLTLQESEDEGIAKVRLIVPHSEGQTEAASNVYPCFYEITFQKMRD